MATGPVVSTPSLPPRPSNHASPSHARYPLPGTACPDRHGTSSSPHLIPPLKTLRPSPSRSLSDSQSLRLTRRLLLLRRSGAKRLSMLPLRRQGKPTRLVASGLQTATLRSDARSLPTTQYRTTLATTIPSNLPRQIPQLRVTTASLGNHLTATDKPVTPRPILIASDSSAEAGLEGGIIGGFWA